MRNAYIMTVMIQLINCCCFVISVYYTFRKRISLQITVILWTIINVAALYYVASLYHGSEFMISYYGYSVPFYLVPFHYIAIVWLVDMSVPHTKLFILIAFILAAIPTALNIQSLTNEYLNTTIPLNMVIYEGMFINIFFAGVLCPITIWSGGSFSIFSRIFKISRNHIRQNINSLVIGISLFIVIYFFVHYSFIPHMGLIQRITTIKTLLSYALFGITALVLPKQIVLIGMSKYALDLLFKDEETTKWEIPLLAMVFAAMHYNMVWQWIFAAFLYGLIYAYLYLKTNSLFYGVVLHSMVLIFSHQYV